jgi:hypothetical protein
MADVKKVLLNEEEGLEAILGILEGSKVKTGAPVQEIKKEVTPAPVGTVYEHGMAISVNGKKTTTGPKKATSKKGGAAKDDKGKDALKEIYTAVVAASYKEHFNHSTEGLIIRQEEADYALKVSKSKEFKFDPTEEGFEVEKDFTVRGKAKNSAPGISKAILAALEASDIKFTLISAKASGIILHMMGGEYTIKISKKRDRVGFEAEKGAAYEK